MTAFSEACLCREAEMCFASIALITDTDVYGVLPVTAERVAQSMKANVKNVNKLLFEVIPRISTDKECSCNTVLDYSLY
jgi:5'-methylthioadenosine phosphorylase